MPMTRTATATHAEEVTKAGIPAAFHVAAAMWICGMLVLAVVASGGYEAALQEDRFVEWWTVGLFAVAAYVRGRSALSARRPFDLLVALFCLFVAGEEFSWGQRLFGFTPPAAFLEHNTQQELTLHNFADVFGQPKGVLILALVGYGIVLPAVMRLAAGRRLGQRLGAVSPPLAVIPWFVAAVALLIWYPADFTGEWVEALAGGLFLATARPSSSMLWRGSAGSAAAAIVLSAFSGWSTASTADISVRETCARAEGQALLSDIATGHAATTRLSTYRGAVHKRVWTAAQDGYLDPDRLAAFSTVDCGALDDPGDRRRFMIDPWGMPYWVRVERAVDGDRLIIVYSMGPNRRRDGVPGSGVGDDIPISGRIAVAER